MNNHLSIVIDADIARSSGTSVHPTSSSSRCFLENVSKNGHKAVVCPLLMSEWKKHRSLFAKKWLASMIARKKVHFIKPEDQDRINQLIESNISDLNKRTIATKDAHLINAALLADKVVASNDDTARGVFCDLSDNCGDVRAVKWFNAVHDRDFLSGYLVTNCFVPQEYFLVNL